MGFVLAFGVVTAFIAVLCLGTIVYYYVLRRSHLRRVKMLDAMESVLEEDRLNAMDEYQALNNSSAH